MEPSVEEKFNDDLWYVLQKIRKHVLYGTTKKDTKYPIVQGFFGTPYNEDEKAMMEKLHEWGVIALEEQNGALSFIEDKLRIFIIKSINPKFPLLYRLFENALKEKISAKRIFDLRQELIHPIGQDKDLSFEVWRLTKTPEGQEKKKSLKILSSLALPNIRFLYGLSAENRSKIKRIIELIQNKLELAPLNRLTGELKIPLKLIEKEGYSLSEAELLIETIDRLAEHSFIRVIRDRRSDYYTTLSAVQDTYYGQQHRSQREQYLILSLMNGPTLQDIKDHIEAFEKRLSESSNKTEFHSKKPEPIKIEKENSQKAIFLENNFLCFSDKKISVERGQKSMVSLFMKNAKIFRGDRLAQKGNELEIQKLIEAGGYRDKDAFRDGLKRLRAKIKNGFPASIENPQTGKYQMVIRY